MTAFNFIGALEAGQSRGLAMASSRPLVANGFPDARVCAYIMEAVINCIQLVKYAMPLIRPVKGNRFE